MADTPVCVVKVGGSILRTSHSYRCVARHLADRLGRDPGTRLVVVVSAEFGLTDSLIETARGFSTEPAAEAVDLLCSTGELRSVALLALALQGAGVSAAAANVHQTGLTDGPTSTSRMALRLGALLAAADVVVAPGFLARGPGDTIVSLGRGGSDLTAVLFAAALGAPCELLKDVPGYFSADPAQHPGPRHLEALGYEEAIALAERGCRLVQTDALLAARRHDVPLVIGAIDDPRQTIVSPASRPVSLVRRTNGIRNSDDSRRSTV